MTSQEIFFEARNTFEKIAQNEEEIVPFLDLILRKKSTDNFLEIGTQYGATFYMLSKVYKNKKLSVDLPEGIHGGLNYSIMDDRNKLLNATFSNVHMITGNSKDADVITNVGNVLNGEKLDLLFIDGDHTYEGVKSDYTNYKQFVRDGGIIAFHDIVHREENVRENVGVPLFWNELTGNKLEFVCNCSWAKHTPVFGGIGVLFL